MAARVVLALLAVVLLAAGGQAGPEGMAPGTDAISDPAANLLTDGQMDDEEALANGAHDTVTTLRKAAEADSAAAAAEEASKTDQEKMDEEVESVMKTLKPRHGHGKATNASELMADPETDEFMGRANADIIAIANDALKLKGKMHGRAKCKYSACGDVEVVCPALFIIKPKSAWKACCFDPALDCKKNATTPEEKEDEKEPDAGSAPKNATEVEEDDEIFAPRNLTNASDIDRTLFAVSNSNLTENGRPAPAPSDPILAHPKAGVSSPVLHAGMRYCLLSTVFTRHQSCTSHIQCRQRDMGLCSTPLKAGGEAGEQELKDIVAKVDPSKLYGALDDDSACLMSCTGHTHCDTSTAACTCDMTYSGAGCLIHQLDHGLCNNGTCICDVGYQGETCDVRTCPNHCSNAGECSGAPDFECACLPGHIKDDCSLNTCLDLSNCSGNGVCFNGTCECAIGFGGQDCSQAVCTVQQSQRLNGPVEYVVCSGNGKCANNVCKCAEGWAGPACGHPACHSKCGLHGVCALATMTCKCDPGWEGLDCMDPKCPKACSGHGVCGKHATPGAGRCFCSHGWTGVGCGKPSCGSADNQCSGNGECVDGSCKCKKGWKGAVCHSKSCPENCRKSEGKGTCVNGKCFCATGWGGPACGMKQCKNDCNDHGICQQNGTCTCDNVPGDAWKGKDCSVPVCFKKCSGHGECSDNFTCLCETGFTGGGCDKIDGCPNPCVNGKCSKGSCWCQLGWTGVDCSESTCPSAAATAGVAGSGRVCSGHGKCEGTFCKCEKGWVENDCNLKLCPKGAQSPGAPVEECSGRGECYNGTCKCTPQYHGAKCEQTCPTGVVGASCSGHGACKRVDSPEENRRVDPKLSASPAFKLKESRCYCTGGFTGHDCNQKTCPGDCSGNGYCSSFTGTCMCKATYVGKACQFTTNDPSVCARNCSNTCIVSCRDTYNDVMDSIAVKKAEGTIKNTTTTEDIAEMAEKATKVCVKGCVDPCLTSCMKEHVLGNPLGITADPAATEVKPKPIKEDTEAPESA